MNTLYKITFGTEFDKNGNPTQINELEIQSILEDVAQGMGGYSLISHQGGYMHDDGHMAVEESNTLEILGTDMDAPFIEHIAKLLKKVFNQESVIVTTQSIKVRFI